MKSLFVTFCLFFFSQGLFSQDFAPQRKAALHDHMIAINQAWTKVELEGTPLEFSFERESQRIKTHLRLVENYLRHHPPTGLSSEQLRSRNNSLDRLRAYADQEKFPLNHFHTVRTPYFIDQIGTACAVGHLIIESGNKEIAKKVSRERNYAYIAELDRYYPEIAQWANHHGFTVDELAWIQPGYPPINQEWNQVGNGGGVIGKINVMDAQADQALYFAGDFTEVDGVAANSIIGWDGEEWFTLGEGVDGVINDMYVQYDGIIYIVGDFQVNENPELVNIAYWEEGEWKGFGTSTMTGSIHCSLHRGSRIYIGGSFEIDYDTITSASIKHLAYVDSDEEIKNDNQAFSVNGNVRDITYYNGNILVAGNFTETAFYSGDPEVNHFDTDYLAYYNPAEENWTTAFEQELGPLAHCYIDDGYLGILTNDGLDYPGLGSYGAGLWDYFYFNRLDPDQPTGFSGRAQFEDITFTYGNILFYPLIGTYSKGILVSHTSTDGMGGTFDGPVRAVEKFQGEYYFAGDFATVQSQPFSGLASSPFDGITPISEASNTNNLDITSASGQIQIHYQNLKENYRVNIYSMNGQLITSKLLLAGDAEVSISTENWSPGIYFYAATTSSKMGFSGKLSVIE